eukprot:g884.t1
MHTVLLRHHRHWSPNRFVSNNFYYRPFTATSILKRQHFAIRSRRTFYEVVYCTESTSSNDRIVPDQSQEEITIDPGNHETPAALQSEPEAQDPTPEPPESPEVTWGSLIPKRVRDFWGDSKSAKLLKDCFGVLRRNLWTLMSLTALNSATRFLLVWTLYKIVCILAVNLFGIPATSIPQEMIPTSSSLGDPDVYQQVADITFLVFKPFDFVLRGVFIAAGLMACQDTIQKESEDSCKGKTGAFIRSLWNGFVASLVFFWKSLKRSKDYMFVYIVAGALTVFYQGLALLIVPLLYALRKLMNIQLALCANLFQEKQGKEAFKQSTEIVEPIRRYLYFPYLLLLLAPKLLGVVRDMVVKVFPDRLFAEVPEITWGLIACTTVTAFLMDRMADILPIVVFTSSSLESETMEKNTERS